MANNITKSNLLMVEQAIRTADDYPTKKQLWKSLPTKITYKYCNEIVKHLEDSNKILIARDKKIMWIWNPKLIERIRDEGLIVR